MNIALVNELKLLCLRMGIDIWEVIEAAKTKPFGFHPFYPGPGLGGHCIPVDPFYLSWKPKEFDFNTEFIELAGKINVNMPYHVVESVAKALNQQKKAVNGSKVLVLGVAYKKDIDDLRESPSLTIIELLQKAGAEVSYNDPYFPYVGRGRHYDLQMHCTPIEKASEFDCVVIITDHSDYDYAKLVRECKLLVDTRNATRGIQTNNVVHCYSSPSCRLAPFLGSEMEVSIAVATIVPIVGPEGGVVAQAVRALLSVQTSPVQQDDNQDTEECIEENGYCGGDHGHDPPHMAME